MAYSESVNETDLGRDTEKLRELNQQVKKDIAALADFCKTCKPIKKKEIKFIFTTNSKFYLISKNSL